MKSRRRYRALANRSRAGHLKAGIGTNRPHSGIVANQASSSGALDGRRARPGKSSGFVARRLALLKSSGGKRPTMTRGAGDIRRGLARRGRLDESYGDLGRPERGVTSSEPINWGAKRLGIGDNAEGISLRKLSSDISGPKIGCQPSIASGGLIGRIKARRATPRARSRLLFCRCKGGLASSSAGDASTRQLAR